jgi:hypothetical protein
MIVAHNNGWLPAHRSAGRCGGGSAVSQVGCEAMLESDYCLHNNRFVS